MKNAGVAEGIVFFLNDFGFIGIQLNSIGF